MKSSESPESEYNVNRLLKSLQIRFVIAHGNLIEFVRNQTIYHDDDIDKHKKNNFIRNWPA